jgi:hypothetical protein
MAALKKSFINSTKGKTKKGHQLNNEIEAKTI